MDLTCMRNQRENFVGNFHARSVPDKRTVFEHANLFLPHRRIKRLATNRSAESVRIMGLLQP